MLGSGKDITEDMFKPAISRPTLNKFKAQPNKLKNNHD